MWIVRENVRKMPLFKIMIQGNEVKKLAHGETVEEVMQKAREKFEIGAEVGKMSLFLPDGTEIDEDAYLLDEMCKGQVLWLGNTFVKNAKLPKLQMEIDEEEGLGCISMATNSGESSGSGLFGACGKI